MASIVFEHVTKRYADGVEAVTDMNLAIADGEFMILVGPSGSGKSTALRMVAGLEDLTEGSSGSATTSSTSSLRGIGTSRWCSRTTRCIRT